MVQKASWNTQATITEMTYKNAILKEDWMIKTITELLEFQLGSSSTEPMKVNKPETNLSAVGNLDK